MDEGCCLTSTSAEPLKTGSAFPRHWQSWRHLSTPREPENWWASSCDVSAILLICNCTYSAHVVSSLWSAVANCCSAAAPLLS
jgi:hypothetical protein